MHFENPPPLVAILRKAETMMTFVRFAVVALMLTPTMVASQNFEKGLSAYAASQYEEAARWYRRAAEQGHAEAQTNLGLMHYNGRGVIQDYTEAARWYRKAAEQGHAEAQELLGSMYFTGDGVGQDYAEAARWNRRAAEQGHAFAQYFLGLLYNKGWGVAQDHLTAHMWFNIANSTAPSGAAREARGLAEHRMTATEIAEAQQRAKACMASDYQDCD